MSLFFFLVFLLNLRDLFQSFFDQSPDPKNYVRRNNVHRSVSEKLKFSMKRILEQFHLPIRNLSNSVN